MGRHVIWTIKDLKKIIEKRIYNDFDAFGAVSGDRGNGKSTLISKVLFRFPKYNPKKHQVYSRDKLIKILKYFQRSFCFDDEAINSGYKRDFYERAQKDLIKILTNYRDNYNVFFSAVPNFFSLDKDLRDLVFLHIQVIERGIAVIHMPLKNRLYSQDKWDVKNNERIERSWTLRSRRNPNFKIPYHKLSTFAGYLYFGDMTEKQKRIYKEVKQAGRGELYEAEDKDRDKTFYQKLYDLLIERKLTQDGLRQLCLLEDKKVSAASATLNRMLRDNNIKEKLSDLLKTKEELVHSKVKGNINDLVPEIP